MQPRVMRAFGAEIRKHVRDTVIRVARLHPPGLAKPCAEGRIVQPRLPPEKAKLQAKVARLQAGEMLGDHTLKHRRIGWRARDRRDPHLADRVDQKIGRPNAERHDQRARRLKRHVIGQPAHPHLIVQAMHHRMIGRQPGRAMTPPADLLRDQRIAGREGKVHRLTRGAGCPVQAVGHGARRGKVVAKGRMIGLRLTQLRLVRQRQLRQVAQVLGRCAPLPKRAVKGRRGDMRPLHLPRRLDMRREVCGGKFLGPGDGPHRDIPRSHINDSVSRTASRSCEISARLGSFDSKRLDRY